MLELLKRRGAGKTICPSEVARTVAPNHWRPLMGEVRAVAAKLVKEGRAVASQAGDPVDPATTKGPIRIGLPRDA